MWGYGDGRPEGLWGILLGIGWGITGFVAFLIWIGIIILLVRFLLIATRAAKVYLTQNGHDAGVFPKRPTPPVAPAAAQRTTTAPVVKPATAATKPVTKPPKPIG
ncbi:MAG: hypothetical protein ABIQ01_09115 [Pseudolysinimonas sp.]